MSCLIRGCIQPAVRKGLCRRHLARQINRLGKIIDKARIREKPYKALHVKEKIGIFG